MVGSEPTTFRLQGECSSQAELHWHFLKCNSGRFKMLPENKTCIFSVKFVVICIFASKKQSKMNLFSSNNIDPNKMRFLTKCLNFDYNYRNCLRLPE